jgi:hypothetical protein
MATAMLLVSAAPLVSTTIQNYPAAGADTAALHSALSAIQSAESADFLVPEPADSEFALATPSDGKPLYLPRNVPPHLKFPAPAENTVLRAAEPPMWTMVGSTLMLMVASRHRHHRRRHSVTKLT